MAPPRRGALCAKARDQKAAVHQSDCQLDVPHFLQPPFDPFVVNRNIHQHHPSHRSAASHRAPQRALELPSSTRDLAQRYLPACACNWFICCPEVVFVTGALDHSTGFSLPPQAGEWRLMVSSSQASTASADVSDDDATILDGPVPHQGTEENPSKKNTTQQDKHNKLGATVKWTTKDQQRTHPDLTFDLQYHASHNTAFFKLRASVEMKRGSLPDQVLIFILLAPEVIQTVSLDCEHGQELGLDTVALRFELRSGKSASIIVPKDVDASRIPWKNERSSDTWDSLRSLVHASHFDVLCCLPRRAMSEVRLRSMCDALSGSQVSSTPGYADLSRLYAGMGGKVVQFGTEVTGDVCNESPPAYQDLEPGPPMPPVLPEKASNKRRRGNSDVEPSTSCEEPGNDMEAMKAWLLTTLEELETRHKAREAGFLGKLEESKVRETALRMEVDKLKEHQGSVDGKVQELEAKVQELEAKIDELDDELEVRIDCKVDDLDQTLPSRMQGVLEGAIFSARF